MSDSPDNVVNLNKFRKAKARDEKGQVASTNRVAHGRTKAEKTKDKAERETQQKTVDDHQLPPPVPDPDDKEPA